MKKFLEKVAGVILKLQMKEIVTTTVILPNRRSEVFLRDHLKRMATKSIWLPRMQTIDEFMVSSSGMIEKEPIHLFFDLFKIHRDIAGVKAKPVEEFLTWAPIMLADFNDIDLYIADPENVFNHLSEAKAITTWNLDRKPLTPMQLDYVEFYNSLLDYYNDLNELLLKENSGYKGMIYRSLANNIESLSQGWKQNRFIIAGFNALSEAEKKVFDHLHNSFQTDFLWDIDDYFFTEEGKMEAGRFINKLVNRWNSENVRWVENNLLSDNRREINIVAVSKRIGQVKFAAARLKKEFKNNEPNVGDTAIDTAIVLADEKLLTPLLNSLPDITINGKQVGYNITMGFPLSNSPFSHFMKDWLELLIQKQEHTRKFNSVRHLISILNNPVIRMITGQYEDKGLEKLLKSIYANSAIFLSKNHLLSLVESTGTTEFSKIISLLIPEQEDPKGFVFALINLLQFLKIALDEQESRSTTLEVQLLSMMTIAKQLNILASDQEEYLTLKAIQRIVIQLLRREEIHLKGEPLSGIQVMGMLETRNLDFDNIILLGANEGILPKTDSIESFIPFDIRSVYNLPLPKDKTDVFAYHFFRLIQRARKVTMVYNSIPDDLGGGEMSRYILQLKNELCRKNPNILITEEILTSDVTNEEINEEIVIQKNQDILQLINNKLQKGLSPTSLSTYINCPLQFYFSYLLNIKPPDELEQSVESDVFGNVVHGVLEEMYKEFENASIAPNILIENLKKINIYLDEQFSKYYKGGDLSSGKNLLIAEVARKYIERFVKNDIKSLKKDGRLLVSVEEKLVVEINNDFQYKLLGKIDRIDKSLTDGSIRLIDYKTGSVEQPDLKLANWDQMTGEPKFSKVFQLLFYCYLYIKNHPEAKGIAPGIFSLRKHTRGLQKLILPENADLSTAIENFEEQVHNLVSELCDQNVPITQTTDEENCNWCDYKTVCNRQGKSMF